MDRDTIVNSITLRMKCQSYEMSHFHRVYSQAPPKLSCAKAFLGMQHLLDIFVISAQKQASSDKSAKIVHRIHYLAPVFKIKVNISEPQRHVNYETESYSACHMKMIQTETCFASTLITIIIYIFI